MLTLTTSNGYNNSPNFGNRSKLADKVARSIAKGVKKVAQKDFEEIGARDALQQLSTTLFVDGNQNGRISIKALRKALLNLATQENYAFYKRFPSGSNLNTK